ncbi:MAG: hypothetical protein IJV00_05445 [Clostridia bacterium]|nr:hypothetical protein [Clostridia bacterium]
MFSSFADARAAAKDERPVFVILSEAKDLSRLHKILRRERLRMTELKGDAGVLVIWFSLFWDAELLVK